MSRPAWPLDRRSAGLFARAVANLERYRPGDPTPRAERLTRWLCNFSGITDQMIALRAAANLMVVDPVAAVGTLRERLEAALHEGLVLHAAYETSGAVLLRILEKEYGVDARNVLKPEDFARLAEGQPPKKLAPPGTVVHWDSVYGSGSQYQRAVGRLRARFPDHELAGCFLIASPDAELPPEVLAAVIAPRCEDALLDLDDRLADDADPYRSLRAESGAYRRPMLATPPDNCPNNVPLVMWAPEHEGWATLLDRRPTVQSLPTSVTKAGPTR